MHAVFGSRDTFVIEIGESVVENGSLRPVDIWLAGRSLCVDDNIAYVPSFGSLIRSELGRLRGRTDSGLPFGALTPTDAHRRCRADNSGEYAQYWFMHWGPTTDNLTTYLFRIDEEAVVTTQFWRPHMSLGDRRRVLHTRLPLATLGRTLTEAVDHLSR